MNIHEIKLFGKEARIITENFDEKYASGINPASELKNYIWALHYQAEEYAASLSLEKRIEILEFIAKKYQISNLNITSEDIEIGEKKIVFQEYYPTEIPGTQSLKDLSDMDSCYFREKIARILAIIPGGIQDFRELAEPTPFIFN